MLQSCTGRRHIRVDDGQSHKCMQPKVAMTLYTVTCLAIIILGALALAGVFHQASSLGVLGHTFGKLGAGLLIGIGALLLFGNFCYCPAKKFAKVNWQQFDLISDDEGHDYTGSASSRGGGHNNFVIEDLYS